MKQLIRKNVQALGLYEDIGIALARLHGWRRKIAIRRLAGGDFCLQDHAGRKIFLNRKHAIYLVDFVKYFEFYFDCVVPEPPHEIHYETPGWHTPRHWGRPLYFPSFAESEEVMGLYLEYGEIASGDVVLDLGAYCGLTALAFAEQVGDTGHVYAFEPDPNNFAALQKNLERYQPRNLTAENLAVWKEAGQLQFQAEGTVSSMVQSLAPRSDAMVSVQAVRLADYIEAKKIQRIDLIKMDVEGSEIEILNASREVLRKFRPTVIVEAHHVRDVITTAACQSILHDEGYRTCEVAQPGTKCPLIVGKALA